MRFRKNDTIWLNDNDIMGFTVVMDEYMGYTVATKIRGFYERILIITLDGNVCVGKMEDISIVDWNSEDSIMEFISKLYFKEIRLNPKSMVPYNNIVREVKYYDTRK